MDLINGSLWLVTGFVILRSEIYGSRVSLQVEKEGEMRMEPKKENQDNVYEKLLQNHDLYWSQSPKTWDDAAFLGNGMLGVTIYNAEHKSKRQTYRFVMGRMDVVAHRKDAYAARVPVGEFELDFGSWIYGGTTARLRLWDAQFDSDVITVNGSATVSAYLHSLQDVMVIEVQTDEKETARMQWYPYPAVSEALLVDDGRPNIDQYFPEIAVGEETIDGVKVHYQQYNGSEDGCTSACLCVPLDDTGRNHRYYVTVLSGHGGKVGKKAVQMLREAAAIPAVQYQQSHRKWWHDYYKKSMLTIPDTRLEGFYWIQLYKMACATRADKLIMDNQGPWTGPTPWPGTWMNMNVQLAYSPVYASNHLEIGASLIHTLQRNMEHLIENVPQEFRGDSAAMGRSMSHDLRSNVGDEIGNLPWICHCCYLYYRSCMDDTLLRDFLYPLLRRSMNYYFHLLAPGQDGKLHLPKTISPEYGSFRKLKVEDCNYDLFLLHWGIQTLKEICDRLSIVDEQRPRWEEIERNLPQYPQDETGYLIGKGVPMEHGHRHYSHLLGYYPLHILDCDLPENRKKLMVSLRHWFGMEGDLRGFTFVGAACLAATLGKGDEAMCYIRSGLELFKPNTFYREAGPVIESPLGMAHAILYLMMQSYGGVVRLFPALPSDWKDAAFADLRAEGAFLVSAKLKDQRLVMAKISSLAGEPLLLRCPLWTGTVYGKYEDGSVAAFAPNNGIFSIPLQKGQTVLLSPERAFDEEIVPLPKQSNLCNFWGSFKPWRLYGIPFSADHVQ